MQSTGNSGTHWTLPASLTFPSTDAECLMKKKDRGGENGI
jgi:hypothetical protein